MIYGAPVINPIKKTKLYDTIQDIIFQIPATHALLSLKIKNNK